MSAAQRTSSHTSFAAIAKEAGVSRSWLYTQQDLVTAIRQLQNRQPSSQRTGSQPASIAFIQRRLEIALARIKQLRAENSELTPTARDGIRRDPQAAQRTAVVLIGRSALQARAVTSACADVVS
ncbi:transposase [Streptomyces sp. NBC_00268]|uniref:transposase n=1 Tax=Streptomyces sp. NBC_00268 TaxID=2975695 RepID=UPI0022587A0C|nr:transposase [Streptomyces sp. NBC_00268]MCX5191772.1 transposase [Streptomyces sp. NBC_00268]